MCRSISDFSHIAKSLIRHRELFSVRASQKLCHRVNQGRDIVRSEVGMELTRNLYSFRLRFFVKGRTRVAMVMSGMPLHSDAGVQHQQQEI